MTTGGVPGASDAANSRPPSNRIPIAEKYPGPDDLPREFDVLRLPATVDPRRATVTRSGCARSMEQIRRMRRRRRPAAIARARPPPARKPVIRIALSLHESDLRDERVVYLEAGLVTCVRIRLRTNRKAVTSRMVETITCPVSRTPRAVNRRTM